MDPPNSPRYAVEMNRSYYDNAVYIATIRENPGTPNAKVFGHLAQKIDRFTTDRELSCTEAGATTYLNELIIAVNKYMPENITAEVITTTLIGYTNLLKVYEDQGKSLANMARFSHFVTAYDKLTLSDVNENRKKYTNYYVSQLHSSPAIPVDKQLLLQNYTSPFTVQVKPSLFEHEQTCVLKPRLTGKNSVLRHMGDKIYYTPWSPCVGPLNKVIMIDAISPMASSLYTATIHSQPSEEEEETVTSTPYTGIYSAPEYRNFIIRNKHHLVNSNGIKMDIDSFGMIVPNNKGNTCNEMISTPTAQQIETCPEQITTYLDDIPETIFVAGAMVWHYKHQNLDIYRRGIIVHGMSYEKVDGIYQLEHTGAALTGDQLPHPWIMSIKRLWTAPPDVDILLLTSASELLPTITFHTHHTQTKKWSKHTAFINHGKYSVKEPSLIYSDTGSAIQIRTPAQLGQSTSGTFYTDLELAALTTALMTAIDVDDE